MFSQFLLHLISHIFFFLTSRFALELTQCCNSTVPIVPLQDHFPPSAPYLLSTTTPSNQRRIVSLFLLRRPLHTGGTSCYSLNLRGRISDQHMRLSPLGDPHARRIHPVLRFTTWLASRLIILSKEQDRVDGRGGIYIYRIEGL